MSLLVFPGFPCIGLHRHTQKEEPTPAWRVRQSCGCCGQFFRRTEADRCGRHRFSSQIHFAARTPKVNIKGLKIREGKTFHWAGEYEVNMKTAARSARGWAW
ncbi:MAG: hypothetical protein CM1200mP29_13100 [Verrucomicrobiota bacterium]|nr:MAG: hypothetical protein CM1200mP29_13100 [Verrucomicrobiota bacterium]